MVHMNMNRRGRTKIEGRRSDALAKALDAVELLF